MSRSNHTLRTFQIKTSQCSNSFTGNLWEPTNVRPQGGPPINPEPQHRNIPAIEKPLTLWQQNINMGFTIPPSLFQNYAHQIRDCLGPQTLMGSIAGPLLVHNALTTLSMDGEICAFTITQNETQPTPAGRHHNTYIDDSLIFDLI